MRPVVSFMLFTNGNIPITAANPINSSKQRICLNIPRKAGKFINGRQNNCWTFRINFLINKIHWNPNTILFVLIKHTISICTINSSRFSIRINIKLIFRKRFSAKWASQKLLVKQISFSFCFAWLIRFFYQFIKFVRCYAATYPEANTNRFLSILRICFLTDKFSGNNHFCNSISLLCCQKAQRITEYCGNSTISVILRCIRGTQSAISNYKRHQAQICLSFTATSRKIQQIDYIPVFMFRVNNSTQIHQYESNLEWSPVKICIRLSWVYKISKVALYTSAMLFRIAHNISLK